LCDAWEGCTSKLFAGQLDGGVFLASFEVNLFVDDENRSVENLVRRFVQLAAQLEGENKQLWQRAESRLLSIGYESELHGTVHVSTITQETLAEVAAQRMSIEIMVYPKRLVGMGS
jgi:hypothetical protein